LKTGYWDCAAFPPDGKTLATGSGDFTVRLWDIKTGNQRFSLPAGNWPKDGAVILSYSADGQILATSNSQGGRIELWRTATGKQIRSWRIADGNGPVWCVALSPDVKSLVSTDNVDVRLWDVSTGKEQRRWELHGAQSIAISPNGKMLAIAGSAGVYLFPLDQR